MENPLGNKGCTLLRVDLSLSIIANIYNRPYVVPPPPDKIINDTEKHYRPCYERRIVHRRRGRRIRRRPEAEEPDYNQIRACENIVDDTENAG